MLYDDALSSSPTCKTTARLHTTHQYLLDTKIYLETSPWEITSSNHLVPSSKDVDICMFHMMLAHMLHIDPSISDIAAMCSAQFPVYSALKNIRSMSTVFKYCNHMAAVLLEYLRVLFLLSSSFILNTSPDKPPWQIMINLSHVHIAKQLHPDQGFQLYC